MKKHFATLLSSALICSVAQAATLTVNSTADASMDTGFCTLRGAVAAINGGGDANGCVNSVPAESYNDNDTIVFDSSLAGHTINVTNGGQIVIGKNLVITGLPDAGNRPDITLDGNGNNRIFNVTGGSHLSITGVKFVRGATGNIPGGAVYAGIANYTLNLRQCAFENNQPRGDGGAVYTNSADSLLIIVESSFNNNSGMSGGAVMANTAAISHSTFDGNLTSYGPGGAVYATTATISHSTFSNNAGKTQGGAVYATSSAAIDSSTFSGNSASSSGGAVSGIAVISHSTFSDNQANNSGGAVDGSTTTISHSTFIGNRATNTTSNGGAVRVSTQLDARHLTFLDNTAGRNGQAVYVSSASGTSTLHNSIVIGSDSSPQCAGNASANFNGSYNLEGYYDGSGNWVAASAISCGSASPVTVANGTALGDIISDTLDDNGGPTPTLALSAYSPLIGEADPSGSTSQMWDFAASAWVDATQDQRDFARRPAASRRDIGAYEDNLRFDPATLPDGQEGVGSYTGTPVGTVSGGAPAYSFAWSGGDALPAGVMLEPSGILSGTPGAGTAGDYSFEVTVTDAMGRTATGTLTWRIRPRVLPTGSTTPIPTLPTPLLLALMTLVGVAAVRQQAPRRRSQYQG